MVHAISNQEMKEGCHFESSNKSSVTLNVVFMYVNISLNLRLYIVESTVVHC